MFHRIESSLSAHQPHWVNTRRTGILNQSFKGPFLLPITTSLFPSICILKQRQLKIGKSRKKSFRKERLITEFYLFFFYRQSWFIQHLGVGKELSKLQDPWKISLKHMCNDSICIYRTPPEA